MVLQLPVSVAIAYQQTIIVAVDNTNIKMCFFKEFFIVIFNLCTFGLKLRSRFYYCDVSGIKYIGQRNRIGSFNEICKLIILKMEKP